MKKQNNIAKAGTLICIDEGAYSDYSVIGFFVVLQDFEPLTELQVFRDTSEEQKAALVANKPYFFNNDKFLSFLLKKGFLLEIAYGNLYLSEMGSIKNVSFTPSPGK